MKEYTKGLRKLRKNVIISEINTSQQSFMKKNGWWLLILNILLIVNASFIFLFGMKSKLILFLTTVPTTLILAATVILKIISIAITADLKNDNIKPFLKVAKLRFLLFMGVLFIPIIYLSSLFFFYGVDMKFAAPIYCIILVISTWRSTLRLNAIMAYKQANIFYNEAFLKAHKGYNNNVIKG